MGSTTSNDHTAGKNSKSDEGQQAQTCYLPPPSAPGWGCNRMDLPGQPEGAGGGGGELSSSKGPRGPRGLIRAPLEGSGAPTGGCLSPEPQAKPAEEAFLLSSFPGEEICYGGGSFQQIQP